MTILIFADAKRLIGRKYSDSIVQSDVLLWPFKVVAGDNDKPTVLVKYRGKEASCCRRNISYDSHTDARDCRSIFGVTG